MLIPMRQFPFRMARRHSLSLLGGALLAVGSGCQKQMSPPMNFTAFVDAYWDGFFRANPTSATYNGVHTFDATLEDMSAAHFARRVDQLKAQAAQLAQILPELSGEEKVDGLILSNAIAAELHEIETLAGWKSNPMAYAGKTGESLDLLMKRDYAPAAERLQSAIGRLRGVPALMEALRANVKNPPKEFTDLAILMADGSISFLNDTLAPWAKQAAEGNPQLWATFTAAKDAAVAALSQGHSWLEKELLPKSTGSYAIGRLNFEKKLRFEEMVELPLDDVLRIGEANLEKDYQDFVETARRIDPNKTPAQVMEQISQEHPSAEDLIPATRRTLGRIRQFLIEKKIINLPPDAAPKVEETPPFMRSGGFAFMDSPGAFETKPMDAYYYVTPVETHWDKAHQQEHLRLFNRPVLDIITIHEAFPGHFVQFLHAKQFPTKTRKLYSCGTNVEGWAHYTEQMMVEEGFGNHDPKLRLAQLSEALLRDVRYVAGIKLHTQGWTVEEATKLFMEKAFQPKAVAFEEARRGTYNPTYLYYTLGKLQLLRLREDYKKAKGNAFQLAEFHEQFVKQGGIPIRLIREILLGANSAPGL